MGMGIPIVHGVPGESARIVERDGVGIVFRSGSQQALYDAMIGLKDDEALFENTRRRCIEAAPNYDRSRLVSDMPNVLNGICRKTSPTQ